MALRVGRCLSSLHSSLRVRSCLRAAGTLRTVRRLSATTGAYSERRYTDKHEWISLKENIGTVGISHYAQEALGDVVYVSTAEVGATLAKGDSCGEVESVKAVSEVYSPVSGCVTEVNQQVLDNPSLVNTSTYDNGWLLKLELSNTQEVQSLFDENAYAEFLKTFES